MPFKDPQKRREYNRKYMRKWRKEHPEKVKEYRQKARGYTTKWIRKYRKEHPEYVKHERKRQKTYRQFNRSGNTYLARMEGILKLGGCCIYCIIKDKHPRETGPLKLETHHPFGAEKYPEIRIQICEDCHRTLHGEEQRQRLLKEYKKWGKKWGRHKNE